MKEVTIEIKTNPKVSWMRVAAVTVSFMTPVGIGVVTDSAAMQWTGFIVGMLILVGMAVALVDQDKGLTIEQAQARIDEIKRREAQ